MSTTLDIVRRVVGKRSKITKDEMGAILRGLVEAKLVDLCNPYVRGTCDGALGASIEWTKACRGITCISVDSRGLRDGYVRYDAPGSMHPQQHAEITFVPADIDERRTDGGSTIDYMRRHADRLLLVKQDHEHAGEIERQTPQVAAAEDARQLCECENGHRWSTDDPERDWECPTCGEPWV